MINQGKCFNAILFPVTLFIPIKQYNELSIIYVLLVGDVAGSVEAITDTLATFHSELCDIAILHSGVGDVTSYDLELAEVFKGIDLKSVLLSRNYNFKQLYGSWSVLHTEK